MQSSALLANIDAMWFVFLFLFPNSSPADLHTQAKDAYQTAIRKLLKEDMQGPWESLALLEEALVQYPNDARIQAALAYARKDLKPQSLEFKISMLFPDTWTLFLHMEALRFLSVLALACFILSLSYLKGRVRLIGAGLSLCISLPLLTSVWARHNLKIGIITKDESGAYTGPGEAYACPFSLNAGASVVILEDMEEAPLNEKEIHDATHWTKIRTLHPFGATYRMAWVPTASLWRLHARLPASMQPHPSGSKQPRKPHARSRAVH